MDQDRPGVADTPMDVTDAVEAPPPDVESPPEAVPPGQADAPGSPDAVAPDPTLPQKFVPPDRGDPFTLKFDRTDIPIEGARVIDDHIVIPKDTWERDVQHKWLANRSEWIQREEQYKQAIGTLQQQTIPEERQRAQAMLAELGSLLDDKNKLIEWLDNFEQNAPLLKQKAETRILQERLERFEQERANQDTARQAEELRPRLQSYLGEQIVAAQKEFAGLAGQKDLADRVWKFFAPRLYSEDSQGQIQFNHELFRDLMLDEAKRAATLVQHTAKAADVVKKNAAAVGQPRTPTGQYTKEPPPEANRPLTDQEWEDRFAAKKYR